MKIASCPKITWPAYRIHGILRFSSPPARSVCGKRHCALLFFCYSFAYGFTRDLQRANDAQPSKTVFSSKPHHAQQRTRSSDPRQTSFALPSRRGGHCRRHRPCSGSHIGPCRRRALRRGRDRCGRLRSHVGALRSRSGREGNRRREDALHWRQHRSCHGLHARRPEGRTPRARAARERHDPQGRPHDRSGPSHTHRLRLGRSR